MSKLRFLGSTEELKALVEMCDRFGRWRWNKDSRQWRFTGEQGEILAWYVDGGTVQFQGQELAAFRAEFEDARQASRAKRRRTKLSKPNPSCGKEQKKLIASAKRTLAQQLHLSAERIRIAVLPEL